ncbi:BTB/POZ domain-containing protein [Niabella drilacis]|uniref:Uncharacterized protein n=1 Tax=Niabella drilacis (strain DSM 25811 / CCM 8410 / CCUG 62505 / LMG 26954 / E90) TaxID=1285928 RepID=A0A1G6Y770_NIADE|nr:hypothetical protein [Niabella drilacis]SDD86121.1 hypothetical protein SAMN04487894_1154 [Niabella drilacis]
MKIQIRTPCHENWEAMVPRESGRYCNTCCKTVVDFTGMTPDAISAYLVQHQSQKICGRLTEKQLATEYNADVYAVATHISRSGWPLVKRVAAVFVLLFVLSYTGNAQVSQKDSQHAIIITGRISQPAKTVSAAGPFATPAPLLPATPAQCLEARPGTAETASQIPPLKKERKQIRKQQRKKQKIRAQQTDEVVVVAGQVQWHKPISKNR